MCATSRNAKPPSARHGRSPASNRSRIGFRSPDPRRGPPLRQARAGLRWPALALTGGLAGSLVVLRAVASFSQKSQKYCKTVSSLLCLPCTFPMSRGRSLFADQTGKTVLVVEDERDVRASLRCGLQDQGFGVIEADSRNKALDMIRRHPVDLVTLDLCLGSDYGLDLARDLRELRNVPIIIVTALGDPQDRVRGLENGADDYITKPFHFSEIAMRINAVLRRYELE